MRTRRAHRSATDKSGRFCGLTQRPGATTLGSPRREPTAPISHEGWPLAWLVRLNQSDKPVPPSPTPFSPPHLPPSPVPLPPSSSAHPSPSALFVYYCICALFVVATAAITASNMHGVEVGGQFKNLARSRANLANRRAHLDWRMSVDTWPQAVQTGPAQTITILLPSSLGAPQSHPRPAKILIPYPHPTRTDCAS